jgi:hypothetical protein
MQKVELLVKINMDVLMKTVSTIFLDLNRVPFVFVIMVIQNGVKHSFANFSRYVILCFNNHKFEKYNSYFYIIHLDSLKIKIINI